MAKKQSGGIGTIDEMGMYPKETKYSEMYVPEKDQGMYVPEKQAKKSSEFDLYKTVKKAADEGGMKKGGKVKSASARADGCAIRGKTRA